MRKYRSFMLMITARMLLHSAVSMGQSTSQIATPPNVYPKDIQYYDSLAKYFLPLKPDVIHKTMKDVQLSILLLTEDKPPAEFVQTVPASLKIWSDEEIFSKRKSSVFIIDKLQSPDYNDSKTLKFHPVATAFAISTDGVCVTNYHVLQDLFNARSGIADKDSVYFVVSPDKKAYLIDSILAFSKNNDLAIFKVNTHGDKLNSIPLGKPANVGAAVYCISNLQSHFYYFSKGMVARNVTVSPADVAGAIYSETGKPPIRMEITADYGVGSSGGPVLDRYGNLIGIVVSTFPIIGTAGKDASMIQMMIKDTSPVQALTDLLGIEVQGP